MQKYTIAFLVTIISTILLFELALEIRAYYRNYDTLLFGKPSVSNNHSKEEFGPTETFPFRSRISNLKKSSSTKRFWLASASYGEDTYVPASKIFATGICDYLASKDHQCEMLNASKAGIGLLENQQRLRKSGKKWKPDIVLIYQLKIDIDWLSRIYFLQNGEIAPPKQEVSTKWSDPFRQLWESTVLYAQLSKQITSSLMLTGQLKDTLNDTKGLFRKDLLGLIQLTRELGAEPILITFAARYRKNQLAQFSSNDMRSLIHYNQHLSKEGWLNTINSFNKKIRQIAVEEKLTLIDLDQLLERNTTYYRDFSHFTQVGHKRVGELIASELIRLQVVSP